jgi:hypothetical protein
MKIVVVGAVENVGKAKRFLRSFFQVPCGNHQEEDGRRPTFVDFHRCVIFNSASRPAIGWSCDRKLKNTPSPLRINVANR